MDSPPNNISLLWPPNSSPPKLEARLDSNALRDLDLGSTIAALDFGGHYYRDIERPLNHLCDEAEIIRFFSHATRHSLILLNESLTSTSAGESLYLARDIVRILQRLETRAVFATHLYELAAEVDQLNAETGTDSKAISLVASLTTEAGETEFKRSYKVRPGPPLGHSLAREVARHYGIGYEQLTALLEERGVLNHKE